VTQPVIAVVDEDLLLLEVMREVLVWEGYRVLTASDRCGALALVRQEHPALVVLDRRLDDADTGLDILQVMRLDRALRDTPVIVCTADTGWLHVHRLRLHTLDCSVLPKPFDLDRLCTLVQQVVRPGTV
jgi:CheY-like chemotaxis protein